MKKLISVLLTLSLLAGFGIMAAAEGDYTIVSPYSDVVWQGD